MGSVDQTRYIARQRASARASTRSSAIALAASAKVNLTLEVVERLPDGYHRIRSVIVRLRRLADRIRIRVDDIGNDIRISTNTNAIPTDDANICHRAAYQYLQHARRTARVDIDIQKAIPIAAGLGGGSSDAAAVLLALNRHFGKLIPSRELAAIGADIGKDIPFFLTAAATCRVQGTGDVVQALPPLPGASFLIVNPCVPVSTKEAYAAVSKELWFMNLPARVDRSQKMVRAVHAGDLRGIAGALYNDFEPVIEQMHPILKEVKQALLALGARGALMSGSGPTVFGLFTSVKTLAAAQSTLSAHYPAFIVARG